MILAIDDLLTPAEVVALRETAASLAFGDGRATAGRFAREVKANDQALPSPGLDAALDLVRDRLSRNEVFAAAVRPRVLTPLILSRYREGQTYGMHVDDALMKGVRTDVSFTLFLSDPDTYEGGALEVSDHFEAREIRLDAGSLVLYPSTTLHRVTPVTRGERLAVVGWAESWISDAGKREILFDLDRSVAEVHGVQGKSDLFDTLAKTRSNLIRMWAGD